MRRLLGVAAAVGAALLVSAEKPKLPGVVRARADEFDRALVRGDFGKLADLTHPGLAERSGGRAATAREWKSLTVGRKHQGIIYRSARAEEPREVVAGGSELYAVVPVTWELAVPGGRATQRTFLVAVSADAGATWSFVPGDTDRQVLREVLPNLPESLTLPESEPPVVATWR